jgi:hypoxanthine phosphoribosyltransferase
LKAQGNDKEAGCRFAHEREAEFSRFLDFYGIQWCFESTCFALRRDEDGKVVESFTPDFYLPQFSLYVELTTMKQRLVTKKNRKLRLMKELYPDVRVKILYGRDYRKLLFKFGILDQPLAFAG